MEKVKVTQDVVYQYMLEHNVSLSDLAREMQANATMVAACFKRNADRNGKPRHFTAATLPRLNEGLSKFAAQMRQCVIPFGSNQVYTNHWGATYDPATVEPIRQLANYFNLTALVVRVLGWSKTKKSAIISDVHSKAFGCVSRDDVNRLNADLLAVAGVLSSSEIIPDEEDSSSI